MQKSGERVEDALGRFGWALGLRYLTAPTSNVLLSEVVTVVHVIYTHVEQ